MCIFPKLSTIFAGLCRREYIWNQMFDPQKKDFRFNVVFLCKLSSEMTMPRVNI